MTKSESGGVLIDEISIKKKKIFFFFFSVKLKFQNYL